MQSIADLSMGERFKVLARQITLDVHNVLAGEAFIMSHILRRFWHMHYMMQFSRTACIPTVILRVSASLQGEGMWIIAVCHQ